MELHRFITAVLFVPLLLACENPIKRAVRNAEYSGYEFIGVQKRDLLKRDIDTTKDNEKAAAETFTDALDQLRKLYAMPGTELEHQYNSLKSAYDDSERKAKDVHESREKMETVAADLFREWKSEIEEMQSPELKAGSRTKLEESTKRFTALDQSLTAAEKKMNPVLVSLKDHVLYLKHNLNAESLTQLKKEHDRIGDNIEELVKEMKAAITKADAFIATMK